MVRNTGPIHRNKCFRRWSEETGMPYGVDRPHVGIDCGRGAFRGLRDVEPRKLPNERHLDGRFLRSYLRHREPSINIGDTTAKEQGLPAFASWRYCVFGRRKASCGDDPKLYRDCDWVDCVKDADQLLQYALTPSTMKEVG